MINTNPFTGFQMNCQTAYHDALEAMVVGYIGGIRATELGGKDQPRAHIQFSNEAIFMAYSDCAKFMAAHWSEVLQAFAACIDYSYPEVGRDFWYIRNGIGNGITVEFFKSKLNKPAANCNGISIGEILALAFTKYRMVRVYEADDLIAPPFDNGMNDRKLYLRENQHV